MCRASLHIQFICEPKVFIFLFSTLPAHPENKKLFRGRLWPQKILGFPTLLWWWWIFFFFAAFLACFQLCSCIFMNWGQLLIWERDLGVLQQPHQGYKNTLCENPKMFQLFHWEDRSKMDLPPPHSEGGGYLFVHFLVKEKLLPN